MAFFFLFVFFCFLRPEREEGEETGAEVVEIWTLKNKQDSVTFVSIVSNILENFN